MAAVSPTLGTRRSRSNGAASGSRSIGDFARFPGLKMERARGARAPNHFFAAVRRRERQRQRLLQALGIDLDLDAGALLRQQS